MRLIIDKSQYFKKAFDFWERPDFDAEVRLTELWIES